MFPQGLFVAWHLLEDTSHLLNLRTETLLALDAECLAAVGQAARMNQENAQEDILSGHFKCRNIWITTRRYRQPDNQAILKIL